MSNLGTIVRGVLATIFLFIWTAEFIVLPGQGKGTDRKTWVLQQLGEGLNKLLPSGAIGDWIEAKLVQLFGLLIDWLVREANKQQVFNNPADLFSSLFSPASGK